MKRSTQQRVLFCVISLAVIVVLAGLMLPTLSRSRSGLPPSAKPKSSSANGRWDTRESYESNSPAMHKVGTPAKVGTGARPSPGLATPKPPSPMGPAKLRAAPPGSLPALEEELWVIARARGDAPARPDDGPGSGVLVAKLPDQPKEVPVPLKHTDVKASISGYIATVEVTQQFHNPFASKIEAVYVFPLPQNSAVNEFLMTVGERRIRGIIREREEAKRIYLEARRQGHVASLLTQERPNVFTQRVANIEPGKQIDINVKYFHTLAYRDGYYEFVFPMVVGPRYNPPGSNTGIGAVARGRRGASGQNTEVQYLKPTERSGHDISLAVDVHAGVPIEEIASKNHAVNSVRQSPDHARVVLSELDAIPNKDFVLRYRVAGRIVKSALMVHRDKRGGFFTLMLFPPAELEGLDRTPVEMVFVLDCSGSMRGKPIAQAKDATSHALRQMRPTDTFQIIRFSNDASQFGPRPIAATPANVGRALAYVQRLHGSGGTQMIEGIKAALDFPHDPERLRFVCFLTDGFIGNDRQIVGEVHKRISQSRIFSFGVGSSPNRYLLNRMAKEGRGAVAYLGLRDSGADVMDHFFQRVSHAALTDIEIEWGTMQVSGMFPSRVPDLFVGRPVILTGRFKGKGETSVTIRGKMGGEARERTLAVRLDDAATHTGIAPVWARAKIAHLYDRATHNPSRELPEAIKDVALDYGLMSAYTAFVAVDSLTRTAGDHGTTVAVPVPTPEGVRYDTTVRE